MSVHMASVKTPDYLAVFSVIQQGIHLGAPLSSGPLRLGSVDKGSKVVGKNNITRLNLGYVRGAGARY
jgi:hypothetical protein